MNSPSKRRKKNDGSSQPVRKLEHFFAKQTAKAAAKDAPKSPDETNGAQNVQDASTLTDEEYARKLQEEWNKEDQAQEQQLKPPSSDELYADAEKPTPNSASTATAEQSIEPEMTKDTPMSPQKQKNTLTLQSTATEEDTITANRSLKA